MFPNLSKLQKPKRSSLSENNLRQLSSVVNNLQSATQFTNPQCIYSAGHKLRVQKLNMIVKVKKKKDLAGTCGHPPQKLKFFALQTSFHPKTQ